MEINRRLRCKIVTAKQEQKDEYYVGIFNAVINNKINNTSMASIPDKSNRMDACEDGEETMDVNEDENVEEANDINSVLERKYPRKFYEITVTGRNLEQYPSIHDRIKELYRCVGVKDPIFIQQVLCEKTREVSQLKIGVNTYDDYVSLMGLWPDDAFGTGVKVDLTPPKLVLNILNVDKAINFEKNDQDMEARYGLMNIERIYTINNVPTNKLKASAKTISDYIRNIKNGIYIDTTERKHNVTPNIIYAKTCNNCGSINHKSSECMANKRCLRCGEYSHIMEQCNNTPMCINCSGNHVCNSEACVKVNEKIFSMNAYVLSVLEGEGVIKSKNSILRTKIDPRIEDVYTASGDMKIENLIKNIVRNELSNEKIRVD
ncbi:unnamed protein product [Brachionus calyciflorus]|uniref:CCHC-type domain-containing protein n=1 Tax=Brachionus calyciflorus TaxID=104777 RepID=A0A814IMQ6_9BILA|nr:unnamed protein product [Brachionus calyciflorus]